MRLLINLVAVGVAGRAALATAEPLGRDAALAAAEPEKFIATWCEGYENENAGAFAEAAGATVVRRAKASLRDARRVAWSAGADLIAGRRVGRARI